MAAATVAVIHITVDPVALHVGALAIHWYGVLYGVAFIAGFRYGVLPHLVSRGSTAPPVSGTSCRSSWPG